VILVARLRPPLKLADEKSTQATGLTGAGGAGGHPKEGDVPQALVLGPRQEIFAWSPRTRRYRQLSSEEGRVLAVARSADGRRIAYVTAEKLIRTRAPDAAKATHRTALALRGVTVIEMDLSTLVTLGRAAVLGDVRSLDMWSVGSGFAFRIDRGPQGIGVFAIGEGELQPRPGLASAPSNRPIVTLTGQGVAAAARQLPLGQGCPGSVRDVRPADAPATVVVTGTARRPSQQQVSPFSIGGPHGAGLFGLPIP
ncbi:MAG: hypothetical protein H7X95_08725, partial [Deltaproteobacteria bacterium]|nr:hypothetical protein [Deltaproteobacteria bacterium]